MGVLIALIAGLLLGDIVCASSNLKAVRFCGTEAGDIAVTAGCVMG